MVRRDPGDDQVEGAVGERQVLGTADHVGPHPRRRIGADDRETGLAQPSRDMPAAGGDVERRLARPPPSARSGRGRRPRAAPARCGTPRRGPTNRSLRQLHGPAGAVEHRRLRVQVRAAPPRRGSCRPSSAFVPSRRTTIGCSIVICSSAARIPRATSSQRVIPPKMLKKIDFTCGSCVITSSASTTPCASPPPPRSQKFAGVPPTSAITSSVDIDEPGAVAEDADLAVELHVGDALLARERLERVGRRDVAHRLDLRVLVEGVVVDRELRVERLHLALGRDDQRVDLAEHRVAADERVVELARDRGDLLLLARVLDAGAVDEPPGLPGLEALERVDVQPDERLRRLSPRPPRCRSRPAS